MAISPIILNGTIQQTQDVLQNQTKETHKAMLDQGNIFAQEVKQEHQKAKQVVHSENSQFKEERFDAKEKVREATREMVADAEIPNRQMDV